MSHTKSAACNTLPKRSINDSNNLSKQIPENRKTLVLIYITVLKTSPKFLQLVHLAEEYRDHVTPSCQGHSPAKYTFSVGS